jgi:hypothetical protein
MVSFYALVTASLMLGQANATPHHEELKVLEPLIGVWEMSGTIEEDSEYVKKGDKWQAQIKIFWVLDDKFIQWEWVFTLNGKQTYAGKQFAAWNPKTKKIVQWWCDTWGGHGTGEWEKQGDKWVMHISGVDGTGKTVSADRVVTVKGDTQTFQDTNAKEDEVSQPDGVVLVLKRVAAANK